MHVYFNFYDLINMNAEISVAQNQKWFYPLLTVYIIIIIIIMVILYFLKSKKGINPLKRFFIPSYGNVERMKAIGKYFDAVEGVLPKPGVTNINSFDKMLNISDFTRKDSMNLLYLMLNTTRTPNQQGLGISSNAMDPWEDSFLHSTDASLFVIKKLNDTTIKFVWRKDYRTSCTNQAQKCTLGCGDPGEGNIIITGYRLYKYYPPYTSSTLIEEKTDTGQPFFTSVDSIQTDTQVCYYVRSIDQNGKELYYSNPACIIPSTLTPFNGVVCASITGNHDPSIDTPDIYINSYTADFYTATDDVKFYFNFMNKNRWGCSCENGECYEQQKFYSGDTPGVIKDTITISDKSGDTTYYHYKLTKKRSDLSSLNLLNNNAIGHVYCPSQYNPVLSITPPDYRYASAFPSWGVITTGINNRIQERLWFGYFMKLTHPAYVQKIQEYLSTATKYGYNGAFFDMLQPYRVSLHNPWGGSAEAESVEYPDQPNFQDSSDLSKNLWTQDAIKLIGILQDWKKKTLPGFKLIGNSLPIAPPDYIQCYFKGPIANELILKICEPLDGALSEAVFPEGYGEPMWSECMRIFDTIVSTGKVLMLLYPGYNMIPFLTDPSKANYRLFLIASSLMIDGAPDGGDIFGNNGNNNGNNNKNKLGVVMGAHTATDMTLGPYADLQPEFNLPLGNAISNRQWTGDVFIKKFQSGVVVVNPSKDDKYLQNRDIVKYGIRGKKSIFIGGIGNSDISLIGNTTLIDKTVVPQIGRLVSQGITLEPDSSILVLSLTAKVFI